MNLTGAIYPPCVVYARQEKSFHLLVCYVEKQLLWCRCVESGRLVCDH